MTAHERGRSREKMGPRWVIWIGPEQPKQGVVRAQVEHVGDDPLLMRLQVDPIRIERPERGFY